MVGGGGPTGVVVDSGGIDGVGVVVGSWGDVVNGG